MKPTRVGTLVAVALVCGLIAYLVAELAYGSLPVLPAFAPISLVLLAVVEVGMARVVRDRMTGRRGGDGRPRGRPLHPMQVARAAVLAKASSPTGGVLFGAYAGLLAYVLPRRGELSTWGNDALVSAVSAAACLALVVAALLLERACRTPADPA